MKSIDSIKCPYCEQLCTPLVNEFPAWNQLCSYCKNRVEVTIIKDEEGIYYYSTQKYKKS